MNIVKNDIDTLNATLVLEIAPADYSEKVSKQLKDTRKKVQMPGFRPGMVPAGLVKKMYGNAVLAEVVNDLIGESLYNYMKENNLNVLGEPINNEEAVETPQLDINVENTYKFAFDIAVAPEFKIALNKTVPAYEIEVSDEMVDKQVDGYAQRYGEFSVGKKVVEADVLTGKLTQVDGEIVKENVSLSPNVMVDAKQKKLFIGKKIGDVVTFSPKKAFQNEAELASMLGIDKEIAKDIENDFTYEITNIRHYEKSAVDQSLFDKVYGEGAVKDEAEFKAKIKEEIAGNMEQDQAYRFGIDAKAMIMKQMAKLEFPEAFLKRWVKTTDKENKMTDEQLEAEFPQMLEELKWQLAKDQIAKEADVKVNDDDVVAYAKMVAKMQFMQYGIPGVDDQLLENYAHQMLQDKNQARGIVDRVVENKVFEYVKSKAKLSKKTISYEDFGKLFEEK